MTAGLLTVGETVDRRYTALAVISGVTFSVTSLIGLVALGHFWDPPSPGWSPEAIRQFYVDHGAGIRIGGALWLIGLAFLVVWTVHLGLLMWRVERDWPLLSVVQILCGVQVAIQLSVCACLWIGAAYRPQAHPDTSVLLSDAGLLAATLTWPSLTLQMFAVGIVGLKNTAQLGFPRWLSKFSIIAGIITILFIGPAFTKTGPFAYDGALSYYFPGIVWALWIDLYTYAMWRQYRGGNQPAIS